MRTIDIVLYGLACCFAGFVLAIIYHDSIERRVLTFRSTQGWPREPEHGPHERHLIRAGLALFWGGFTLAFGLSFLGATSVAVYAFGSVASFVMMVGGIVFASFVSVQAGITSHPRS